MSNFALTVSGIALWYKSRGLIDCCADAFSLTTGVGDGGGGGGGDGDGRGGDGVGEWSGVVGLVEVGRGLSEEISASDGVVGRSFWVSWSIFSVID